MLLGGVQAGAFETVVDEIRQSVSGDEVPVKRGGKLFDVKNSTRPRIRAISFNAFRQWGT